MFPILNFVSNIRKHLSWNGRKRIYQFLYFSNKSIVLKFFTQDLVNCFIYATKIKCSQWILIAFSKLVTLDRGFIQFPLCNAIIPLRRIVKVRIEKDTGNTWSAISHIPWDAVSSSTKWSWNLSYLSSCCTDSLNRMDSMQAWPS